ncbi:hypothetical protein PR202_gb15523 [Eleusine coracana subsp. coracana]|uniref:Uncharacterized protein n=1 Tax=Eleusine coracana subsp. coracana TaxID=191504 RepID=A0AAV5EVQ9_ELECO|nr:hypothetical protein PR202_gb15523 [Eleusine coracana subsp. coracana]
MNWYDSFVIHPNGRCYRFWANAMFLWSIYSTFFTPFEFGFFRGLPEHMLDLECVQLVFLADVAAHFLLAYRDAHTYRMVYDKQKIALRVRLWPEQISKAASLSTSSVASLGITSTSSFTVELYYTHTAACVFYYLATTLPAGSRERHLDREPRAMETPGTSNFREVDLLTRYVTSLYHAVVTLGDCRLREICCKHAGYGDIHAVNSREMAFIVVYISFSILLSAYLHRAI